MRRRRVLVGAAVAAATLRTKVASGYMAFLAGIMDWGELSETGYRNTRRLALG